MEQMEVPHAMPVQTYCEVCSLDCPCDDVYVKVFSVYVCADCRYGNPAYKLLTKDVAKKTYLLTDSTMETLPCMRKSNPKHEAFAPLRLYLQKMCEATAIQQHGSLENVAVERKRRECIKYEKAVARTKSEVSRLGTYGKRRKDKHSIGLGRSARRPVVEAEEHKHTFENETQNDDGTWSKECACGLTIHVHKVFE
ncbi:DNA repair protein [Aphanomyces invadans]|uniref:DNA repair protein n=1 Tax=Aphanomyces invadans TaxID=157072 RepID=A0A024U9P2_9STRA|nr:DNA repair protein [Aphanomyces invadans]ETW02612.1 DNA repair protein [Aphanomyces invadans]|eukprot:XP_008869217.1 DNA repair protein [Aphanomyces invadans]